MIESEAELHGVGGTEGLCGEIRRIRVGSESLLRGQILLVCLRVFSDVAVVIGLHLVKEDFYLVGLRVGDQVVVKELKDSFANAGKFSLNLPFILFDLHNVVLVALIVFLLLD